MPQIFRRQEGTRGTPGPIGTTNEGLAKVDAGRRMAQIGNMYTNKAVDSFRSAMYNKISVQASSELSQRIEERKQQTVDKAGNPTFSTMNADVDTIVNDVRDKTTKGIFDHEILARFDQDFRHFSSNKKLETQKFARAQQMEFSKVALNGLIENELAQSLSADTSGIPLSELGATIAPSIGKVQEALDHALADGDIGPAEHQKALSAFSENIRVEHLRNKIGDDPMAAVDFIAGGTPIDLGISENSRDKLVREAQAGVRDQVVQQARDAAAASRIQSEKMQGYQQEVMFKIEAGQYGEKDLEQDREGFGEEHYWKTKRFMVKEQQKALDKGITEVSLTASVSDGDMLIPQYSQSEIETHLSEAVELRSEGGKRPPLSQIAVMATKYKAPSVQVAKGLDFAINKGTGEDLKDAMRTYQLLRLPEYSHVLKTDSFSAKSRATGSLINTYIQNTGVSLDSAAEFARETIAGMDDAAQIEASAKFNDEFDDSDIRSFIKRAIPGQNIGDDLAIGTTETTRRLLEDQYILHGDKDAAEDAVAGMIGGNLGVSSIRTDDFFGDVMMYNPPDLLFPNSDPEVLRGHLEAQIGPLLPPGVKPEDIIFDADDFTRGVFREVEDPLTGNVVMQENVSYNTFYVDGQGRIVPIVTPATAATETSPGTPETLKRWVINAVDLKAFTVGRALDSIPGQIEEADKFNEIQRQRALLGR